MIDIISYNDILGFPVLSCIVFLPIIVGFLLMFSDPKETEFIKKAALWVTIIDFLLSLFVLATFKSGSSAMQFVEQCDWIPAIGASYLVGVDGISVYLIMLTTFLGPLTLLSTFSHIKTKTKEFMICFLFLQGTMLGAFVSLDLLLFYLFWELMLPPMFLIIAIWGSSNRIYSSIKFFLYTLVGSVPMVMGVLGVYFSYHGWAVENNLATTYTFNLLELYKAPIAPVWQFWIFWAFFLGFAIKVPMIPFHTWLPDAHTDAPTAGSVVLAGVLLKMGTYGFVRFSLPLTPLGVEQNLSIVLTLAVIAAVYGAVTAMNQGDMKKLVAYSSVAHMAYIVLGIFSVNSDGMVGGVLQGINHGLSTGGLFLLVGMIYDRRHTREISEYGGLFKQVPIYTTVFVLIMFSSMGVPGLNGFVGELLILIGAWQISKMACVVAILGVLTCAGYLLWMFQRVFLGEITNPENRKLVDLDARELTIIVPIIVMCFVIGLYPTPFVKTIRPSVDKVLSIMNTEKGVVKKAETGETKIVKGSMNPLNKSSDESQMEEAEEKRNIVESKEIVKISEDKKINRLAFLSLGKVGVE